MDIWPNEVRTASRDLTVCQRKSSYMHSLAHPPKSLMPEGDHTAALTVASLSVITALYSSVKVRNRAQWLEWRLPHLLHRSSCTISL
jgi:hypothetical protein